VSFLKVKYYPARRVKGVSFKETGLGLVRVWVKSMDRHEIVPLPMPAAPCPVQGSLSQPKQPEPKIHFLSTDNCSNKVNNKNYNAINAMSEIGNCKYAMDEIGNRILVPMCSRKSAHEPISDYFLDNFS
jgi:hypothetical protein